MKVTRNQRLAAQAVRARLVERAVITRAHQLAPAVAAGTRRRTGETAASTDVETGHLSASGDRPAVRIVQRNVSVTLNFRNDRDYMIRAAASGA